MNIRFYKCKNCGNIVTKIYNSGIDLWCCNEKMNELIPNKSDGLGEKHVPFISVIGNTVQVRIGIQEHPMTEKHHISWICLATSTGAQFLYLSSDSAPFAEFKLANGEKAEAAYAYCNLHGLWKKELT